MKAAPQSILSTFLLLSVVVAQKPPAYDSNALRLLSSDDPAERAAAEASVRAAAKWGIEHGDPSLFVPPAVPEPVHRLPPGHHLEHVRMPRRPRLDNPFLMVAALRDERPEVRAAGAVELRDKLGLFPCASTMTAAGPQPVSWVAERWRQVEVPVGLLPRIVAEARAGRADAALAGRFTALDEPTAKRFAVELVQVVGKLGDDEPEHGQAGPGVVTRSRFAAEGARDELAAVCLGVAMRVHPIAEQLAFALALQTTDDTLRRRVVTAFAERCARVRGVSFSSAIAPMAIAMLDAADEADQATAAMVLARIDGLPLHERDQVAARVLELLPRIAADAADGTWMTWISPAGPVGKGAKFEHLASAAARSGATELIEPLLQRFEAIRGLSAPRVRAMIGDALGLLAPFADESQRRALYEAAWSERPDATTWSLTGGKQLADALFEFAPEDLLGSYGVVAGGGLPRELQVLLGARPGPLPRHLVTLLAGLDPWQVQWELLLPRAPELVLMAIDAGETSRARRLGASCTGDVVRTLLPELLRREPAAVAAAMLEHGDRDRPLALLAHCRDEPKAQVVLAELIAAAPAEPDELRWLRVLCGVEKAQTAAAAAIRAFGHGDAGRELWRETVDRLGAGEPQAAGQALHAMLSVGEALADWREVAERARYDWALVKATEIRFGGAAIDLAPHNVWSVLSNARVTIDEATVRALVQQGASLGTVLSATDGARVAVLEYAASLGAWPAGLADTAARLTLHDDATVRRAAYLALKSRDPELWPHAWLVREAEFDPDPTVRAAAK